MEKEVLLTFWRMSYGLELIFTSTQKQDKEFIYEETQIILFKILQRLKSEDIRIGVCHESQ